MKPVMMLGILIIIISTLFIILIFNTLVSANIKCLGDPENPRVMTCNLQKFNVDMVFGLMLVCFFALLDMAAFYLIFTGAAI
ncbi:MAG: hypothetical protein JXC85_00035 [Candidatus Aenigmarchaeota archaeon]|nr:hypothetical protein [Candidatus Aenigmarchaeota archaeon]